MNDNVTRTKNFQSFYGQSYAEPKSEPEDVKAFACDEDIKHDPSCSSTFGGSYRPHWKKKLLEKAHKSIYKEVTTKAKHAQAQQFSDILKKEALLEIQELLGDIGYCITPISKIYNVKTSLQKPKSQVLSQKNILKLPKSRKRSYYVSEISEYGLRYRCRTHSNTDEYTAQMKRKAEEKEQAIERKKDLFDRYGVFGVSTYD